jgi:hypothetical protein
MMSSNVRQRFSLRLQWMKTRISAQEFIIFWMTQTKVCAVLSSQTTNSVEVSALTSSAAVMLLLYYMHLHLQVLCNKTPCYPWEIAVCLVILQCSKACGAILVYEVN